MAFDNWLTNPQVLDRVRACLGTIDLDPASNLVAQEYVQAKHFAISEDEWNSLDTVAPYNCFVDGLHKDLKWIGNVFCNPPYSAGNIDAFTNKFLEEIQNGNITRGLYLVNSATDARWYHNLIQNTTCTLLWKGRIKFYKIFNGKAHEKWEGQVSKDKGLGKIGNAPRYLNTLFYYDQRGNIEPFLTAFKGCGEFMQRIKTK